MIEIQDLVIEYHTPQGGIRPIDGVSFEMPAGMVGALVGPSGSGKTSLLAALSGMVVPAAGAVRVAGQDVAALTKPELAQFRRETIGIVFQGFNLLPALTAAENVAAPRIMSGVSRSSALAEARDLLGAVGLGDRRDYRPYQMSGGQQQRVAVARGLTGDVSVILADEPTANLDPESAGLVIDLLRTAASDGKTVLVSTHDDRILPVMDAEFSLVNKIDDTPLSGREAIRLAPGELLFRRGDPSDVIYRVQSGAVDVIASTADASGDGDEGDVIATVGPGEYLGELGVLLGAPRSASVRANGDAVLVEVSVPEFREQSGSTRK